MNDDAEIEETEWVMKPKEDIVKWYLSAGIFTEDPFVSDEDSSIVYYESLVTNYVAHHADQFTGVRPKHIWYGLTVHDWRLDKIETGSELNPKSRVVPDLILQFPSELIMVEVKYRPQSPDIERVPWLKTIKPVVRQIEVYARRVSNVMKLGWFPECLRIRPVVFWAYFYPRLRVKRHLDTAYSDWPVERTRHGRRLTEVKAE